jgi:environmental stress-induced protein Ves
MEAKLDPQDILTQRERILRLKGWPDIFLASLALVQERPEFVNVVGLMPFSSCQFAANAKIYAAFTGRKANTVNLGFRTHRIKKLHQLPVALRTGRFDPSNWKIYAAVGDLFLSNQQETFRFERASQKKRCVRRVKLENDLRTVEGESDCPHSDWSMEFDELNSSFA